MYKSLPDFLQERFFPLVLRLEVLAFGFNEFLVKLPLESFDNLAIRDAAVVEELEGALNYRNVRLADLRNLLGRQPGDQPVETLFVPPPLLPPTRRPSRASPSWNRHPRSPTPHRCVRPTDVSAARFRSVGSQAREKHIDTPGGATYSAGAIWRTNEHG